MTSLPRKDRKRHGSDNGPPPEWDLILSAAQKNRPDDIVRLVATNGVDPSHASGVGQSALHVAALWGHVEAAQALLQLGAFVNAPNFTGATPLHMACSKNKGTLANNEKVVDLLLDYGANVAQPDSFGKLALDYVMNVDSSVLPSNINNKGSSSSGNAPTLEEREAHIQRMSKKLQPAAPPILMAIEESNVEEVKSIIASSSSSPVTTTLSQNEESVVNLTHRKTTPVLKTVELLLLMSATNAEAKEDQHHRQEPLLQILQLLLLAGANPNIPDSISRDEEEIMMDSPMVQVLQALREAMPQEEEKSGGAFTVSVLKGAAIALSKAANRASTEMGDNDATADEFLFHAARRGHIKMLKFLLQELNLSVNATNRQGMVRFVCAGTRPTAFLISVVLLSLLL